MNHRLTKCLRRISFVVLCLALTLAWSHSVQAMDDQVPLGKVLIVNRTAKRITFYLRGYKKWEKHELEAHGDELYSYITASQLRVLIYVNAKGNLDVRKLIQ